MKTNEPTRNFDSVDITNDYNVAAQNSQGLYGAFKFFHGIKSFFKGISALGTLATTSKIPVTDNDGNVTYTTPAAIKTALSLVDTTALNGALANYTPFTNKNKDSITNANNLPEGNYVAYNLTNGKTGWCTYYTTYIDGNSKYAIQYAFSKAREIFTRSKTNDDWADWEQVTTTTLLNGALADSVHAITTTDEAVTIVSGGYSQIGKMVIVNFRFKVATANSLINFDTNLPSPPVMTKQYISANIINIQQDIAELNYGYKPHGSGRVIVKVAQANVDYAFSCTYICQ